MRFEVIETFHDFQLIDTVTGRSAGLGDGLDVEGFIGGFVEVGDEDFAEEWADDANENTTEYLEAYFPDLYNLEIYDGPGYIDRYIVVLEGAPLVEKLLENPGNFESLHYCLGLSSNPDSPQGISQIGVVDPSHLAETQERIAFLGLPLNVQEHIARRLEDE